MGLFRKATPAPIRTRTPDEVTAGCALLHFSRGEIEWPVVVDDDHHRAACEALAGKPTRGDESAGKDFNRTMYLVRAPENEHDANAIEVWAPGAGQIGYLSAEISSEHAPQLDAAVAEVVRQFGHVPGIEIPAEIGVNYWENDEFEPVRWEFDSIDVTLTLSGDVKSKTATKPGKPSKIPLAAGWYNDPERVKQLRYWDGAAWTEHTAD